MRAQAKEAKWELELKRWPVVGAAAAGLGVLTLAATIGVSEVVLGAAAAYGAYRLMDRRRAKPRVQAKAAN
jgi:hypothetical protein